METMKAEEKIAKNYLEGLDLGSVQFEPDGNIPPDFSVGTSIGVEVRRLNQNYFGDGDPEGLEELSFPRWKLLHKALSQFDDQFDGKSYLVSVRYGRPSKATGRETAKAIRDSLEDFLSGGGQAHSELAVSDNLRFTVFPSNPVQGRVFLLAGGTDRDSGGWVIPMYAKNISHCIWEKSRKIAPYEYRYGIWWLLLVDYMDWGIDTRDKAYIVSEILNLERFDRVLVIDKKSGALRLDLEDGCA
jgi:hypothetical protein